MGLLPLVLVALASCRSATSPMGPVVVDGFVVDPLEEGLPLVRTVSFETDESTVATWTLTAGEHRIEQTVSEGTAHRSTLKGLRPDRVYTSVVRLAGPSGTRTVGGPDVASGALPDTFPDIEALAWEPGRVEEGFTLINLTVPTEVDEVTHVVLLDDALEPVWMVTTGTFGYARWEDGVWGLSGGVGVHWTEDGAVDRRLVPGAASDPMPDVDVPMGVEEGLHYDILPTGRDSFWTVLFSSFEVEEYPLSADNPEVVPNPQMLRDMVIAELGFDGALRNRWPLSERLDPGRISYSSHARSKDGLDWAHTNAVNHNPDGGVIVSSRHQDAVVALDEDGELQWILANPDGWSEPYASKRLTPIGDVTWPSHQHAPHVAEDGLLVMFDNGNHRGSTPYDPGDGLEDPYTRIVGYRVDSAAMTVEELWSFEDTVTGRIYSDALGDADPLPHTGNVLATYSMLREEGSTFNEDEGRGRLTVRLIEFEPTSLQTVLDLRFSTDREALPRGVRSFRAERVAMKDLGWRVK